jgi:phosphoribosylformimino-5-aminoimidazole carboxamide ribotide isomerase
VLQGAEWLHVVNLDGAFGETDGDAGRPVNLQRLVEIQAAVPRTPIQFGGGMRSLRDMETALSLGATRTILGTVAVQNPQLVAKAVERFGAERIVIGIDARDGQVATHGWVKTSNLSAAALGQAMRAQGVVRVVYTDIARDGMLAGVNVEATASLARETGLQVIASGGVASLEDLQRLKTAGNIEGVIIGQALYAGAVSLSDAIELARAHGGTFSRDTTSRGCA